MIARPAMLKHDPVWRPNRSVMMAVWEVKWHWQEKKMEGVGLWCCHYVIIHGSSLLLTGGKYYFCWTLTHTDTCIYIIFTIVCIRESFPCNLCLFIYRKALTLESECFCNIQDILAFGFSVTSKIQTRKLWASCQKYLNLHLNFNIGRKVMIKKQTNKKEKEMMKSNQWLNKFDLQMISIVFTISFITDGN